MGNATAGDAAIKVPQPYDSVPSNPAHPDLNGILHDAAYGTTANKNRTPTDGAGNTVVIDGQMNQAPSDGSGNTVVIDGQKNKTSSDGNGSTVPSDSNGKNATIPGRTLADILRSLDGKQHGPFNESQTTRIELGKPERLPTGDTEIHERNREIIVMPKDEGTLVINKDGSYDLQLNKNSKEKAEITQKDGVTTITFEPSGDRIQFDKDGLLNIQRGNEGVSWLRLEPIRLPLPGHLDLPPGAYQPVRPNPGDPMQHEPPLRPVQPGGSLVPQGAPAGDAKNQD